MASSSQRSPASLPSSSSSSSAPQSKHDVFLSFRGSETRKGITSSLFSELQNRGIKTFMDDQHLEPGTEISSNLLTAIEESRSAIVLLSPDYASSTWCLDELAKIVECLEARNTIVLPVFYNVDPCDVRHQRERFKEAFTKHEQRFTEDDGVKKVKRWRAALTKVANLSGLDSNKYGSDIELVEGIAEFVCSKVRDLEIESTGGFVEFEATRKAKVNVMKALKDDGLTAIGIYGMGGVGKTTMVKHVAAEAKRKGLFRRVAMAVVTPTPDLRNIQGMLADQLGVKLEEETNDGRAGRLSQVIMSRNKTLIILDDIWDRMDLSRIGIPSYKNLQDCNSKVLLTTRSLDVCNSMESQPNIALNFLSVEDSWSLFVKKTGMSFENSNVFYDVARSVARECAGLPIALVAIATALRDKKLNEWNEAAQRLKSSQPSNPEDVVFNCLKLSYDYLRSEDAKSLFLLCCLFPEDYDIQIEDLLTYGFGKGLFQNCHTLQEARHICQSLVRSLKSSSLLLGTEHDGRVRMHDVIRDVAISISSSEDGQRVFVQAGCKLKKWQKINATNGYCAISLMVNEICKLPKELVCSELQVLLLQHNAKINEIPDSFFQRLDELRVLDLSKTSISVLPPSFCLLKNLHTLYLDSCEKLSDISLLGRINKLQILSLRDCCLTEVPEEIGHLTSLRMLDISKSRVVKIASKVISRLSELEELYMQCNFGDWGSKVEEAEEETNAGFDELTGLLYLNTLEVGISDAKVLPKNVKDHPNWEHFDICISRDSDFRKSTWKPRFSHDDSTSLTLSISLKKTLTLSTTVDTLPDWFINVVTQKAEKLQYRKCKDLRNILEEYDKGRLHELRHLSVIGRHENLEELMNAEAWFTSEPVFQNLEELHLCEVDDVKNLCVGELPPRSLCNLKLLDVRRCHNLVNALLHSTLLQRLQYLEKLFCAHMNGLEYVFGSGKTIFEKLREIRLCYLPKLIKIWNGHAPHAIFHNLKILAVSGCKKLKSVFTSDVAECLSQLEDLWVYSCFSLDRVVDASEVEASEETGNMNVIFPKLKNLVLEDLPQLRRLYGNSSGNATSLDIEFPSLEHFHERDCPKFPPFASNFYSQRQVQVNDLQHYSFLKKRLWGNIEIVSAISGDGRWKYDVFLSFRGVDSRKGITSALYDQLQNSRGIKTFMDDQDLDEGAIEEGAIEESRFAIIVLSQNYASSSKCLEELTKIVQCMDDEDRILPLFYDVEPSDVQYQKRSYEVAFTGHKEKSRQDIEKMNKWRAALRKVANLSGWDSKDYKSDSELVNDIVEYVSSKLRSFAMSTGDFEAFGATRQAMNEVMKALEDDEVTTVGVYGMGGVGKTTMVEHVSAQACNNGIFDHVIKVVVSDRPVLRKIQDTLADQLGIKFVEETVDGRAARLFEEIMRRNRILIILDDIWERIDLPSIGIPSQNKVQRCNSKVLITTRNLNVCGTMGSQANIPLGILSEEDSWTLFARNARFFESTDFHDVARKIVVGCRGLPIALIAVARALRDKGLAGWKNVAQRLEKPQTPTFGVEGNVFKGIKLSYDYLRDEDSKSYFLLCCLFLEDRDIPIEALFRYAIGKGLFQDADTIDEARGTAYSVVKHLKDSSLLLDSERHGHVRMHDVIRDTAVNIAKLEDGHGFLVEAGSGLTDWSCRSYEGYSAISVMKTKIRKLPEELVCSNLQILLLNRNADLNEIPNTFFRSPNELRVLDLSGTSISSLPQSFSLLTNLQALHLDYCKKIIDISLLGKLKKLEILSMREYSLKELSREIGHLSNLRMLDVSGASLVGGGIVRISSEVIPKLHRLEELYMLNCGFKGWGSKIEGEGEETNIGFDEIIGLPYLKNLQVCISDAKFIPKNVEIEPHWVYFNIRIGGCTNDPKYRFDHNSRHLRLRDTTISISTLPGWFVNTVTTNTEKLEYDCCKGLSNILMEYDRGRLHELKHLVVADYFIGYNQNFKVLMNAITWVPKKPVFEKLEELHLRVLPCLKELCVGELPPRSLINLKVLNVSFCDELGNVSKMLQRLPNLEKLYLNCMRKVEYVFRCEGFELEQSSLREMNLLNLDALRGICNGLAPRAMFQSLKSLTIYHCNLLQSLFAYDVAQCLYQLEDLFVQRCHLLERVIEAVNTKRMVLPKLKNLVLKELPVLYSGTATADIECPSLEQLFLEDCPHLSFSTSVSHYFHSKNQIQLNNQQQYDSLKRRCNHGSSLLKYLWEHEKQQEPSPTQ